MNKESFIQEIESFIRTLSFIQEEQSFLKRKLSAFLDSVNDATVLNWVEIIHQQILNRETAIQLLRNDILKLQSSFIQKKLANNFVDQSTLDRLKKYKQQVVYIETEFITWKNIANEQFEGTNIA